MNIHQWQLLPTAPADYISISSVPPLLAQLLYNRKIEASEAYLFISDSPIFANSPFTLPDIEPAVSRIYQALRSGEKIAIYGDFDADGITATVILVETLSWLGTTAIPYLPDRCRDGHGLSLPALEELHEQGANLIITVDCGSSDYKEAEQARKMGMDMIITDHHHLEGPLPQTVAVVNPKRRDSLYPFPELAGVGVAFKLAQALLHAHSKESALHELLDLVALGTVTDLVPLLGENRYLVKEGIKVLNNTQRIGIREMIDISQLRMGHITEEHISWALGPRINAASRTGSAYASYKLLISQSSTEAYDLARELEDRNIERQKATTEAFQEVTMRLANRTHLPILIEGGEEFSLGVIGLVAGKLAEKFNRPSIIINYGPEVCRGSCRSVEGVSILSILEECRDLLITFGGHHMAAGFTLARRNLDKFENKIMEVAREKVRDLDLTTGILIDAEVSLSIFDSDTLNSIWYLAPFGKRNPVPVFLSRGIEVLGAREVGNQGKHLELSLRQSGVIWKAMAFNANSSLTEVPTHIDAVYNLDKDWWNGQEVLRLNIIDFAPSDLSINPEQ